MSQGSKNISKIFSGLIGTVGWESSMFWMGRDRHNREEKLCIEDTSYETSLIKEIGFGYKEHTMSETVGQVGKHKFQLSDFTQHLENLSYMEVTCQPQFAAVCGMVGLRKQKDGIGNASQLKQDKHSLQGISTEQSVQYLTQFTSVTNKESFYIQFHLAFLPASFP